jgi:MFS family permease
MRDDEIRNARLYLVGLAASLVGSSAMSLVAGIWVKSLTGSSAEAGLVSACLYAPSLAGPLAGLAVDRANRRRWLVAVNLVSAATILMLLAIRSPGDVWLIFVAMGAYGLELVLIDPAESALLTEMLPGPIRAQVIGWRLGIQETGRLAAPLLGAALFALAGGGTVAALDAGTFLIAAVTVSMLRVHSAPPASASVRESWWRELGAGVRHIWAVPPLRRVVIGATGVMAASGVAVASQYSLVTATGHRPAFLGVFSGVLGAGSVIAALTSGRLLARVGERRLALFGLINFALGASLNAIGWLPTSLLAYVVLGFALPWVFLATLNLVQRTTPNALQGRASAAITLALFGPQAPMQALGAAMIGPVGFRGVYVSVAAIALALAIWLARPGRPAQDARTG